MATDYYWRWNHCACCNRYTSTHMFSSGLLFRAYSADPDSDHPSPFPDGLAPKSVADWRKLTHIIPGSLYDEYRHLHNINEFWDTFPSKAPCDWEGQMGMDAFQDDQGFWLTYTDFGGPH